MLSRITGVVLGLSLTLGACLAPPSQSQRVTEAAREMNLATRFGRMDLAMAHAAKGAREAFMERRSGWGHNVRIVDVELAGLSMHDEHSATLLVDIAWTRVDESSLRTTRVSQLWKDKEGSWQLFREKRAVGDVGLFGEPMPAPPPTMKQRDAYFPSKTIH